MPVSARKRFYIFFTFILLILFVHVFSRERPIFDYSKIPTRFKCDIQSNPEDKKYISLIFKTIKGGSGLGNQLFEIFALLGMAKSLGRIPFFNSKDYWLMDNLGLLSETVPNAVEQFKILPISNRSLATVTVYRNSPLCCVFEMHPLLKCEQYKYVFIEGNNFQSYKYFENLNILDFLKPTIYKQKLETNLKIEDHDNSFKSCIHYRRGDFLLDQVHEGTNVTFLQKSINFLKNKNPTGTIYIFGNDPKWVNDEILIGNGNNDRLIRIMNTPIENAIEDLHFSNQYCESMIITAPSSTFGWFMGYLSKNQENVYYRDIFETNDLVKHQMSVEDFYPPSWKILKFENEYK